MPLTVVHGLTPKEWACGILCLSGNSQGAEVLEGSSCNCSREAQSFLSFVPLLWCVCISMDVYAYVFVCVLVCMYACAYAYACKCAHMCMCIR